MKKLQFIILLCLMVLMSGCSDLADNNKQAHTDTKVHITEKSAIKIPEESVVLETDEPSIPDTFIEDVWKQYAELYSTTHIFTDMYFSEKAWLIGEKNIVQLTSVAGVDEVSVLTRNNIERIEQSSFADFATVSIIDKTGKTLSLAVSSEELLMIVELLK